MTAPETTEQQPAGWTADASTFGARLALVRQHMGWGNVEKAARECGLPVETWRSWERDNREPHRLVTIAMAIAARTGCDLDWLVYGPTRVGSSTTRQYSETRLIRRVGDPRLAERPMPVRRSDPTRPVRQTRPTASRHVRPRTPVAV